MYIRSLSIKGLRSLRDLTLEFGPGREAGWHVIVGPNGSGKSTVVRALALGLIGDRNIDASREDISRWLRPDANEHEIALRVVETPLDIGGENLSHGAVEHAWKIVFTKRRNALAQVDIEPEGTDTKLPWDQRLGWFSAAMGPFRRLSGGDPAYDELFAKRPRLGAHLSALNEGVALTAAASWLPQMHAEELEAEKQFVRRCEQLLAGSAPAAEALAVVENKGGPQDEAVERLSDVFATFQKDMNASMSWGALFLLEIDVSEAAEGKEQATLQLNVKVDTLSKRIIRILNTSTLLDPARIDRVTQDGVVATDDFGNEVPFAQLSDGYKIALGIAFEILRVQLLLFDVRRFANALNEEAGAFELPGVVIIDEIEAHLHPPWQEKIGDWLRASFPNVQFIVTTHSPIVCRSLVADGQISGSVWQLIPDSEGGCRAEAVTGARLKRLVYGDLVEAVGTQVFGNDVEQSDQAAGMLNDLAGLNRLAVRGQLDEQQRAELSELRSIFPTQAAPVDDP